MDMTPEKMALLNKLLTKWDLGTDLVVKHVLEQLPAQELSDIASSNYTPDKFNQWKSAAELLARFCADLRERKMPGGNGIDTVSAFKFRWQLDAAADKTL